MAVRSSYADRLRGHLADYKRHALGVFENGLWLRNGKPYPHILPQEKRSLNFLPALQEDISKYLAEHPDITLHRDAHHLNSSQVMCINLMFPALSSPAVRGAIGRLVGLPESVDVMDGSFERVLDRAEGTNFDFVAECSDGRRLLWEFKLTESDFGAALDDARHQAKLAHIYAPRLKGLVPPALLAPPYFFSHYQLLRNLWHVRSGDVLILALPAAHLSLQAQAQAFMQEVGDPLRQRIRTLYIEDIARAFADASSHEPRMKEHFKDFLRKYIPAASSGMTVPS